MRGSREPRLGDYYISFTCGAFIPGNAYGKHLDALIGHEPQGGIVIRPQPLAHDETEVGFTVELHNADSTAIPMGEQQALRSQINMLLEKHRVTHSPGSISNPTEDYILADTGHCQKTGFRMDSAQRAQRDKAAEEHFNNRTDITYRIPVEHLNRLARAISEMESLARKHNSARSL